MTLPQIALDVPTLKLSLSIVGGLLLLAMVRILFLLRTNNRLRESTAKMEKQVLIQHQEILSVRQDSNAWRGELQRMFDAFRAEFSKRLDESEQRYKDARERCETVIQPTPGAVAAAVAPSAPPPPSLPPPEQPVPAAVLEEPTVTPVPALNIS
ncbi:hypothetical protein [Prosthecobacter sp.]|uniref:hypothetical protein n=1 Tax=Prosthecobacter sp. TaxID=1965333 RepID=UPI001DD95B13|nr:hypothetical protein [Prosthecobacter sp.]MCB1275766.1 hypothetical protein [Prosthecobacter sp.]